MPPRMFKVSYWQYVKLFTSALCGLKHWGLIQIMHICSVMFFRFPYPIITPPSCSIFVSLTFPFLILPLCYLMFSLSLSLSDYVSLSLFLTLCLPLSRFPSFSVFLCASVCLLVVPGRVKRLHYQDTLLMHAALWLMRAHIHKLQPLTHIIKAYMHS